MKGDTAMVILFYKHQNKYQNKMILLLHPDHGYLNKSEVRNIYI